MLERPGAEANHAPAVLARARQWFDRASEGDKNTLPAPSTPRRSQGAAL